MSDCIPPKDHVGGNFDWDEKPACCDLFVAAVDDTGSFSFLTSLWATRIHSTCCHSRTMAKS